MAQSTTEGPSSLEKTTATVTATPARKHEANDETHRERSSSGRPSPGSSDGGIRGRSRTRHAGATHESAEQDAGGAERQCVLLFIRVAPGLMPAFNSPRGYHSLMSSFGKIFHVEKRWKLIREMGSGAYGYVM